MAEPILWANRSGMRRRRIVVDGETRVERIPAHGHKGNSDPNNPVYERGARFITVCQHDGNIVHMVTTNGAAHLDDATAWGNERRAKAQHFGWFDVTKCPCALALAGELNPGTVIDKSILTAQPCAPGSKFTQEALCPHAKLELEARRAKHAKVEAKRNAAAKPEVEKLLAGQKEQTSEIVGAVAAGMQGVGKEIAAALAAATKKKGAE